MRKRILSILLCLVMVVGLFPTMAFAADGSGATTGSGTRSDPYIVTTFEELKAALEKDTLGFGMQYIKVPNGINIEKDLKPETYSAGCIVSRQKTLIVDGTVTVTAIGNEVGVRSMFLINGSDTRLDIQGSGSLTFKANTNASANAVVDVDNEGTLNVSGGVTLSGTFNTAVYGIAVYNYGGTVNIDDATLTGETGGVSYGGAVFADGGTTNIKNATLKSSVYSRASKISRKESGTIYVGEDATLTIENSIIHTTDGVTDGHSIYSGLGNTKHISDYLGTNQKIYKLSDDTPLNADVSSLTDSVNITDDISKEIDTVSLTISGSMLNTISDFERISYTPYNKMRFRGCTVYKGLSTTSNEIENKDTPRDPHQDYTVMYYFETRGNYSLADTVLDHVNVSGGNFWKADDLGGSTNKLRVYVNFPASTIENVSLTIKPKDERTKISDLGDISYSPDSEMELKGYTVYKGLSTTSNEIENKDTRYNPLQDYTAMYYFETIPYYFTDEMLSQVSVSGGDFWKADDLGGSANKIRVYVNFPGATPIDSVTLNVPKLKEGATSGTDFTLSSTNTGVSTINTVWEGIPTTGAVAGKFYVARITLTAEDGYAFNTKTQVNLNGDYSSKGSGIDNGGAGMTILVSVPVRHEHTFGPWQIAGTGNVHFRECSCGVQESKPHEWKYLEGQDKYKCTVCGYEIDGEKERITYVYASPRSPIAGEHPGDHTPAEWVEIGGANYKVESIVWKNMDDTDVTTFESGKIYKGTVTFKADTGFAFDGDRIYASQIFNSSNAEVVGDYSLADGGTTLTATFKLKDANVVRPGLQVKVKLPTLNDKIGQSLPEVELVDTTLPENVALVYSVYKDNLLGEEITDPNYKVKSNQKYLYVVWLKVGDSTDITEITKTYNVSYEVKDGGDAETHADFVGYGVLAMYQRSEERR